MGGGVEGRGVRLEERLRPVAVVDVDVHHGHALGAVHRLLRTAATAVYGYDGTEGQRAMGKSASTTAPKDDGKISIYETNTPNNKPQRPVTKNNQ